MFKQFTLWDKVARSRDKGVPFGVNEILARRGAINPDQIEEMFQDLAEALPQEVGQKVTVSIEGAEEEKPEDIRVTIVRTTIATKEKVTEELSLAEFRNKYEPAIKRHHGGKLPDKLVNYYTAKKVPAPELEGSTLESEVVPVVSSAPNFTINVDEKGNLTIAPREGVVLDENQLLAIQALENHFNQNADYYQAQYLYTVAEEHKGEVFLSERAMQQVSGVYTQERQITVEEEYNRIRGVIWKDGTGKEALGIFDELFLQVKPVYQQTFERVYNEKDKPYTPQWPAITLPYISQESPLLASALRNAMERHRLEKSRVMSAPQRVTIPVNENGTVGEIVTANGVTEGELHALNVLKNHFNRNAAYYQAVAIREVILNNDWDAIDEENFETYEGSVLTPDAKGRIDRIISENHARVASEIEEIVERLANSGTLSEQTLESIIGAFSDAYEQTFEPIIARKGKGEYDPLLPPVVEREPESPYTEQERARLDELEVPPPSDFPPVFSQTEGSVGENRDEVIIQPSTETVEEETGKSRPKKVHVEKSKNTARSSALVEEVVSEGVTEDISALSRHPKGNQYKEAIIQAARNYGKESGQLKSVLKQIREENSPELNKFQKQELYSSALEASPTNGKLLDAILKEAKANKITAREVLVLSPQCSGILLNTALKNTDDKKRHKAFKDAIKLGADINAVGGGAFSFAVLRGYEDIIIYTINNTDINNNAILGAMGSAAELLEDPAEYKDPSGFYKLIGQKQTYQKIWNDKSYGFRHPKDLEERLKLAEKLTDGPEKDQALKVLWEETCRGKNRKYIGIIDTLSEKLYGYKVSERPLEAFHRALNNGLDDLASNLFKIYKKEILVNINTPYQLSGESNGLTPFQRSISSGAVSIADKLLQSEGFDNERNRLTEDQANSLIKKSSVGNAMATVDEYPVVLMAFGRGASRLANVLLEAGADVNGRSYNLSKQLSSHGNTLKIKTAKAATHSILTAAIIGTAEGRKSDPDTILTFLNSEFAKNLEPNTLNFQRKLLQDSGVTVPVVVIAASKMLQALQDNNDELYTKWASIVGRMETLGADMELTGTYTQLGRKDVSANMMVEDCIKHEVAKARYNKPVKDLSQIESTDVDVVTRVVSSRLYSSEKPFGEAIKDLKGLTQSTLLEMGHGTEQSPVYSTTEPEKSTTKRPISTLEEEVVVVSDEEALRMLKESLNYRIRDAGTYIQMLSKVDSNFNAVAAFDEISEIVANVVAATEDNTNPETESIDPEIEKEILTYGINSLEELTALVKLQLKDLGKLPKTTSHPIDVNPYHIDGSGYLSDRNIEKLFTERAKEDPDIKAFDIHGKPIGDHTTKNETAREVVIVADTRPMALLGTTARRIAREQSGRDILIPTSVNYRNAQSKKEGNHWVLCYLPSISQGSYDFLFVDPAANANGEKTEQCVEAEKQLNPLLSTQFLQAKVVDLSANQQVTHDRTSGSLYSCGAWTVEVGTALAKLPKIQMEISKLPEGIKLKGAQPDGLYTREAVVSAYSGELSRYRNKPREEKREEEIVLSSSQEEPTVTSTVTTLSLDELLIQIDQKIIEARDKLLTPEHDTIIPTHKLVKQLSAHGLKVEKEDIEKAKGLKSGDYTRAVKFMAEAGKQSIEDNIRSFEENLQKKIADPELRAKVTRFGMERVYPIVMGEKTSRDMSKDFDRALDRFFKKEKITDQETQSFVRSVSFGLLNQLSFTKEAYINPVGAPAAILMDERDVSERTKQDSKSNLYKDRKPANDIIVASFPFVSPENSLVVTSMLKATIAVSGRDALHEMVQRQEEAVRRLQQEVDIEPLGAKSSRVIVNEGDIKNEANIVTRNQFEGIEGTVVATVNAINKASGHHGGINGVFRTNAGEEYQKVQDSRYGKDSNTVLKVGSAHITDVVGGLIDHNLNYVIDVVYPDAREYDDPANNPQYLQDLTEAYANTFRAAARNNVTHIQMPMGGAGIFNGNDDTTKGEPSDSIIIPRDRMAQLHAQAIAAAFKAVPLFTGQVSISTDVAYRGRLQQQLNEVGLGAPELTVEPMAIPVTLEPETEKTWFQKTHGGVSIEATLRELADQAEREGQLIIYAWQEDSYAKSNQVGDAISERSKCTTNKGAVIEVNGYKICPFIITVASDVSADVRKRIANDVREDQSNRIIMATQVFAKNRKDLTEPELKDLAVEMATNDLLSKLSDGARGISPTGKFPINQEQKPETLAALKVVAMMIIDDVWKNNPEYVKNYLTGDNAFGGPVENAIEKKVLELQPFVTVNGDPNITGSIQIDVEGLTQHITQPPSTIKTPSKPTKGTAELGYPAYRDDWRTYLQQKIVQKQFSDSVKRALKQKEGLVFVREDLRPIVEGFHKSYPQYSFADPEINKDFIEAQIDYLMDRGKESLLVKIDPLHPGPKHAPQVTVAQVKEHFGRKAQKEATGVWKELSKNIGMTNTSNTTNKLVIALVGDLDAGDVKRNDGFIKNAIMRGANVSEQDAQTILGFLQQDGLRIVRAIGPENIENNLRRLLASDGKTQRTVADVLGNTGVINWVVQEAERQHDILSRYAQDPVSHFAWTDKRRKEVVPALERNIQRVTELREQGSEAIASKFAVTTETLSLELEPEKAEEILEPVKPVVTRPRPVTRPTEIEAIYPMTAAAARNGEGRGYARLDNTEEKKFEKQVRKVQQLSQEHAKDRKKNVEKVYIVALSREDAEVRYGQIANEIRGESKVEVDPPFEASRKTVKETSKGSGIWELSYPNDAVSHDGNKTALSVAVGNAQKQQLEAYRFQSAALYQDSDLPRAIALAAIAYASMNGSETLEFIREHDKSSAFSMRNYGDRELTVVDAIAQDIRTRGPKENGALALDPGEVNPMREGSLAHKLGVAISRHQRYGKYKDDPGQVPHNLTLFLSGGGSISGEIGVIEQVNIYSAHTQELRRSRREGVLNVSGSHVETTPVRTDTPPQTPIVEPKNKPIIASSSLSEPVLDELIEELVNQSSPKSGPTPVKRTGTGAQKKVMRVTVAENGTVTDIGLEGNFTEGQQQAFERLREHFTANAEVYQAKYLEKGLDEGIFTPTAAGGIRAALEGLDEVEGSLEELKQQLVEEGLVTPEDCDKAVRSFEKGYKRTFERVLDKEFVAYDPPKPNRSMEEPPEEDLPIGRVEDVPQPNRGVAVITTLNPTDSEQELPPPVTLTTTVEGERQQTNPQQLAASLEPSPQWPYFTTDQYQMFARIKQSLGLLTQQEASLMTVMYGEVWRQPGPESTGFVVSSANRGELGNLGTGRGGSWSNRTTPHRVQTSPDFNN